MPLHLHEYNGGDFWAIESVHAGMRQESWPCVKQKEGNHGDGTRRSIDCVATQKSDETGRISLSYVMLRVKVEGA